MPELIVVLDDDGLLSWQERALCAQTDPEAFFPEKGGSTREAKRICLGCEVRDAGILPDDAQRTREALAALGDADLILSTGGVSVGEADHLGQVLVGALAGEDFVADDDQAEGGPDAFRAHGARPARRRFRASTPARSRSMAALRARPGAAPARPRGRSA